MNKFILTTTLVIAGLTAVPLAILYYSPGAQVMAQLAVNPGQLSQSHAFLENNCAACHTPAKGVEAMNCIVCHANDDNILQREPTAFHADVGNCKDCHSEHGGRHAGMTEMDHNVLASIGRKQLEQSASEDSESAAVLAWLKAADDFPEKTSSDFVHPALTASERSLNCASCHSNDDRHFGLFGNNCASCHETKKWSLPKFRHPSASSQDCAQCHQAPPSHYMGHFNMISAKVAGKPHAKVNQCFACHQTTSWPDIKKVGWYKHH